VLTVAAATFSGGEEIGIYTALFASENEDVAIITLVSVAMVLTALWSFLANYLVKHGFLADIFRRIGDRILPYMLIVLGLYILTEAYILV
jgi:cadmium resistance protein CadD (predicted permease)